VCEHADHVEAFLDAQRIGERRRHPRQQQPGPGARDRTIDDADQAAPAIAQQGAGQLQVAAGRTVNLHRRAT
jgi:hypothetical protein